MLYMKYIMYEYLGKDYKKPNPIILSLMIFFVNKVHNIIYRL